MAFRGEIGPRAIRINQEIPKSIPLKGTIVDFMSTQRGPYGKEEGDKKRKDGRTPIHGSIRDELRKKQKKKKKDNSR